jgi:hypothetical protein
VVVGAGAAVETGVIGADWTRTVDESEAIGMAPTGGGAAAARCGLVVAGADGWATAPCAGAAVADAGSADRGVVAGATSLTTRPGVTTAATSRASA